MVTALAWPHVAFGNPLAAYDLDEEEWNGLSSLRLVARAEGIELEQRSSVALDRSDDFDALIIVFPTAPLPAHGIADRVGEGLRLLVADDFGTSGPLAERFGIVRLAEEPTGDALLLDHPGLPLVAPVGRHPLSEGISDVVTNHPAQLRGEGVPVFEFAAGTGLLYDMSLGDGVAVFLADPSMLTNLMLPLLDNRALAANVLRYLCNGAPGCRVALVTGDAGIEAPPVARGSAPPRARSMASALNTLVRRLRDLKIDPRALYFASVMLLLGSLVILAAIFPFRPPRWLSLRPIPRAMSPASEFEFGLLRFEGRFGERSYTLPAAILRGTFEPIFYGALGLEIPPPDTGGDVRRSRASQDYVARFEGVLRGPARARRARAVVRFLDEIGAVAPRDPLVQSRNQPIDARSLQRLYESAMEILATMNLDDDFRSRASRP